MRVSSAHGMGSWNSICKFAISHRLSVMMVKALEKDMKMSERNKGVVNGKTHTFNSLML